MRVLCVQETDWLERNPILHHRMLEELSASGDEIAVVDYDTFWTSRGVFPIYQRRVEFKGRYRFNPDSSIRVIRPGTLRIHGLARISWIANNWTELQKHFAEARPDVVVGYSISSALLALRLARSHRIPFVYHLLDALHTLATPRPLRLVAKPIERAVMRQADRVIVVNNRLRDYAVSMGAPPAAVHVLPAGVGLPDRNGRQTGPTREDLGLSRDDFVLLFVGWLYKFSGLIEVVQAMADAREHWPRLRLLVVGDGDLLPELRRLRARLGLESHIKLVGQQPVSAIPSFVQLSDAGLLPTRRNRTMEYIVPAKVLEYMEYGKPVIATRLPGLEAEFGDLEGLIYISRPHEVLAVAETMMAYEDPRSRAADLGKSCQDFVQRRLGWVETSRAFRRLLVEATSGPVDLQFQRPN